MKESPVQVRASALTFCGPRAFELSMSPLKLYDYPASANCYKVRLLLAQLGRRHARVPVDIFGGDTLTETYRRLNPHRSTPVLELATGERLIESGAILVYLAHGTKFLPEDPLSLAQILRWLIFEQTDVIPAIGGLRFRLQTGRLRAEDPDAIRRRHDGEEILTLLEEHLAEREFFVGPSFTIADIGMYGYLHVADEAGYDIASHTALSDWLKRVAGQPGYVDDLVPYPSNARSGAGRSTYD